MTQLLLPPPLPEAIFERHYAGIRIEDGKEVCYLFDGKVWERTDNEICRKVIFGARTELQGDKG